MPITVDLDWSSAYRVNAGQTDTNEVIYELNPVQNYTVEASVTSAGTATMKLTNETNAPTDFTNFSTANDGTQTTSFIRAVTGASYVGLDVASGTWTVRVRRA